MKVLKRCNFLSVNGLTRRNESQCDLYRHATGYHVSTRLSVVFPHLENSVVVWSSAKLIIIIAEC